MSSGDIGEMSDGARMDYMTNRVGIDPTMGVGATLQDQIDHSNPAEMLMMLEEQRHGDYAEKIAAEDETRERFGFLGDFLRYVIQEDYQEQPEVANRLIWSLVIKYYPSLISDIPQSVRAEQIDARHYVRQTAGITMADIVGEEDSLRRECFRVFLEEMVFVKITTRDPMMPTKRVYALAKAFFDDLIKDMSLDKIGGVFEKDMSQKSNRSRWSWRIIQWITKPMKEKGYRSHLTFNKKEESREKYAAAARQTRNKAKYAERKKQQKKTA